MSAVLQALSQATFVTPEDEQWFNAHIIRAIEENINSEVTAYIHPEPYFVDFLREMPEPTGDEPEDTLFEVPKIYELVPSYEFLSEKLQFYQKQFNEIIRGTSLDLDEKGWKGSVSCKSVKI
ncbi:hypothetical protein QTO34_001573 [Cnephaeus nilssonii]|uniref:Uncharacterized protein n=1 Tax=Cnephaeus nilssonii TaxID=3371016 RepID=A0AA40HX40_CNENI|nr:hypothetical protein QTO34_001573 [Eptesicus nilssonii]